MSLTTGELMDTVCGQRLWTASINDGAPHFWGASSSVFQQTLSVLKHSQDVFHLCVQPLRGMKWAEEAGTGVTAPASPSQALISLGFSPVFIVMKTKHYEKGNKFNINVVGTVCRSWMSFMEEQQICWKTVADSRCYLDSVLLKVSFMHANLLLPALTRSYSWNIREANVCWKLIQSFVCKAGSAFKKSKRNEIKI